MMKYIPMRVRVSADMDRLELRTLEEYCIHGEIFFAGRIKNFQKEFNKDPKSWDIDHAVDMRNELETHLDYSNYFGLLMAFSSLERFLDRLYSQTKYTATKPALRDAMLERGGWLKVDDYRKFLKALGIDLTAARYKWHEIVKLNAFRDAIAHQGGAVTGDNENRLKHYKYKKGDWLNVTIDDVRKSIKLVQETVELLTTDYLKALRKKRLIRGR